MASHPYLSGRTPRSASDEYNAVLQRPLSIVLRSGPSAFGILFFSLLIVSALVPYPERLEGRVVFNSTAYPMSVVAPAHGEIESLFLEEGGYVQQGGVIGIIQRPGDTATILTLARWLSSHGEGETIEMPAIDAGQLGDLSEPWLQFRYSVLALKREKATQPSVSEVESLSSAVVVYQAAERALSTRLALDEQMSSAAQRTYEGWSALHDKGLISELGLAKRRIELLAQVRQSVDTRVALADARATMFNARSRIGRVRDERRERIASFNLKVLESRLALEAAWHKWQSKYILRAPLSGSVHFFAIWTKGQSFEAGDEIAVVVPISSRVSAHVFVPSASIGKLKRGAEVVIRLDGHPWSRYGTIKGNVRDVSSITRSGLYRVSIDLPGQLVSSSGMDIPLSQGMEGSGRFELEKRSLLAQLAAFALAR